MKKNGFTLIELLVVIAIIGSLTAIVIGALTSGRSKAQDVKIKSNLGNMRSQAALFYTDNGNYGDEIGDGLCETGMFLDPIMVTALEGILEANNAEDIICYTSDSTGGSNSDTWAVSSPLRTDSGVSWCVDSNGYAEEGDAQIVADSALCQ